MISYFLSSRWSAPKFSAALNCRNLLAVSLTSIVFAPTFNVLAQQRVLGLDVSWHNRGSCSAGAAGITQTMWNDAYTTPNANGYTRHFVWTRASRGGTTGLCQTAGTPCPNDGQETLSQRYDDPEFLRTMHRATTAGLFAGPYHFGRPDVSGNTGADEADHFIEYASAFMRPGYLMPVFDLEAGISLGANPVAQFSIDFSDRLYERMRIRPAVYINGSYSDLVQGATQTRRDQLAKPAAMLPTMTSPAYPMLWDARYANQSNPESIPVQTSNPKESASTFYGPWDDYGDPQPWSFWQYASTIAVPGITTDATLDGNVSQGDLEYVKNYLVPAVWWNDNSGDWGTLANWNSGQPLSTFNASDLNNPPAPYTPNVGAGQTTPFSSYTLPQPRLPGTAGSGPSSTSGLHDTVILERPNANITVTLSSGAYNIRKLYMREALDITGGSLTINYDPTYRSDNLTNVLHGGPISAQFSGPVTLSGTSILNVHTLQVDTNQTFTMAGGTLTFDTLNLMPHSTTPAKILVSGNINLSPLSTGTAAIADGAGSGTSGSIDLCGSNRSLTVTNGLAEVDVSINVPVSNGGLTKAGLGTLRLREANTYSGGTTVAAGKLLVNNTTGSGTGTGNVVVNGGTLAGNGTISGAVTINSGGTIAPGTPSNLGILTVGNSVTLNGTSFFRVDRNSGSPQSDQLARTGGSLAYGGNLLITNVGTALVGGESFAIFSASSYNGTFSATNLPSLDTGLNWYLGHLTVDGTIRVNRSPVVNGVEFTKIPGQVLQIPKASLVNSASDPDSDLVTLAGFDATTTNGVVLTSDSNYIYYSNFVTVSDRFNYTISDGRGAISTGTVQITPGISSSPAITSQPSNRTNVAGTTATFSVTATGSAPLSYQWRKGTISLSNGGNVSGATSATLSLANVSQNDATNYSVIVANGSGSVTSSPALLIVIDPPTIVTHPQNLTGGVGTSATFSVVASGTAPLNYQWRFNGNSLAGATGTSFTRSSVLPTHQGSYSVVVTNLAGAVTSSIASLTVTGAIPNITLTNIWNIQAGSRDYITTGSTERGIALNPITEHTLVLSRSTNISGGLGIYILDSETGAELGTMSVSGITNNGFFPLNKIGVADDGVIYAANMTIASSTTNLVLYRWGSESDTPIVVYSGAPDGGSTARWGDSFDVRGAGTNTQIIVGGPSALKAAVFTTTNGTNFSPNPVGPTINSGRGLAFGDGDTFYVKYAGSNSTHYGFNLAAGTATAITNIQEVDSFIMTIAVDVPHNLFAGVADNNTTNNSGHSLKVYNIANPGAPALVSNFNFLPFGSGTNSTNPNAVGSVDSDGSRIVALDTHNGMVAAKIVYVYPPTILAAPVSRTNSVGTAATFTVQAEGSAPLSFQWKKGREDLSDSGNISGSSTATLTINNVATGDAGNYSVVVSNPGGSITSPEATLSVSDPPVILSHPSNQFVAVGSNAVFSVVATGENLAYAWLKNDQPLSNGGDVSGASSPSLTLSEVTFASAGSYSVLITNASGSVTSSNALLTVTSDDNIDPTVSFTIPSKTTVGMMKLKGTAKDTAPGIVTEVWYRLLPDTEFSQATLSGSPSKPSWESPEVPLVPGTNTVFAYAVDSGGNQSAIISKKFFYDTTDLLTVNIIGGGEVKTSSGAAVTNGQKISLLVGRPSSLSAFIRTGTAATNYVFSNWFGTVGTNHPNISFVMQSNMVLTAQFITNPFVPVSGKYHGLFYETNGVATHRTAGFITIKVTSKSSYSGKILLDGNVLSIGGKFDLSGRASRTISRAAKFGKGTLILNLALDWSTPSQKIFGNIGDGTWISEIEADRLTFSATNPAVNFVGRYTMLIPRTNHPSASPGGFGSGLITNSLLGKIVLSGRTGAGAPLSQSVWISKDGRWPLYVPLYKNTNYFTNGTTIGLNKADYRGSMLGWIHFSNPNAAPTGTVSWIKTTVPPSDTLNVNYFYPAGYTNLLDIVASPFHVPAPGTRVLQFTNGSLLATDGNLPGPVTWNAVVASNNTVKVSYGGSDKVTLTLNSKTGLLKGTFLHPNNGNLTTTFWGAILQNQNYAAGEFLGRTELNSPTNHSGSVIFSEN